MMYIVNGRRVDFRGSQVAPPLDPGSERAK